MSLATGLLCYELTLSRRVLSEDCLGSSMASLFISCLANTDDNLGNKRRTAGHSQYGLSPLLFSWRLLSGKKTPVVQYQGPILTRIGVDAPSQSTSESSSLNTIIIIIIVVVIIIIIIFVFIIFITNISIIDVITS